MTEAEWLACEQQPERMLAFLEQKWSERKRRVFAGAWARRVWARWNGYLAHQGVPVAEAFADGRAEKYQALKATQTANFRSVGRGGWEAYQAMKACAAVSSETAF